MEKLAPQTYDKYIKGIMDISRAITSDLYQEDILKLIVMVTAKVTGVEICSFWLIDEGTDPLKIRLTATQAIDPDYLKDRSLSMNEGIVGYVATHKKPLIIPNVLKEPRFKEKDMAKRLGLVSMVSVPLQVKNEKVIGVLNCFTARAPRIFRNRGQSDPDRCQSGGGCHRQHRIDGKNPGDSGRAGNAKTR